MTPEEIVSAQAQKCLNLLGYNAQYELTDLVSEGMICLHRVQGHWRENGGASFSTYLTAALMHRFRDIMREISRQPKHENLKDEELESRADCAWANRLTNIVHFRIQHLDTSEKVNQFLRLIFTPPPELRIVLRQKNRRPMSTIIADWLGWSRETLHEVENEIRQELLTD